ncbi:hypothetical protein [Ovoidimarina sediminis]|uniref:hypothetical protein n=1 Tax=Ovoidimarina sediminis TaxID=3079856 RepID=UPI00290E085F|nr:hypothetical protein [Rhodophyticola sp. MJ-SS7]MDU8944304.1 hypothetical protein [Rhodophyticola sp. MJ-SS7]
MIHKLILPLAATAVVASVSTASADITLVNCTEFTIGIREDIAIQAEVRAGSLDAAKEMICATAEQLERPDGTDPERKLVHIMPADIHTVVVYFPRAN